jgi:hypothetical protein
MRAALPVPLAAAVLLSALSWGSSSSPAQAAGTPVIDVAHPVFDFGTVPEGDPARHVFKVKNAGTAPLEIRSVNASCGCTAAAPREKQIPPGGSGEIEVTYSTAGRRGRAEKTVTVNTNDPKTPTTTLTIKADVVYLLGFEPNYTFLSATGAEAATGETWLTGSLAAGARPKIAKIEPPGPTKVALIKRPAAGAGGPAKTQWGLRFEVGPKQAGHGTVKVQVATGVSRRPQVEHLMRWSAQRPPAAPAAKP